MKRLLMLKPERCASGDTRTGKIYPIIDDKLVVYDKETENSESYEYSLEMDQKYPDNQRWITIEDESSEDSFEICPEDDRCILFEDDKELAHEMINRIDGLATAITNMAMSFVK